MTVTVKKIDEVAPYSGPHAIEGIRFRAIREALDVSSWGMNVLDFDPHCEGHPEHHHTKDEQEEVYVVLSGSVVLQANGEEHTLSAGSMAHVRAEVRRKLITGDEPARVLALGGAPGKAYAPSMGG